MLSYYCCYYIHVYFDVLKRQNSNKFVKKKYIYFKYMSIHSFYFEGRRVKNNL